MADISKIKLPSNDIYDIKDDYARDRIIYTKEVSGENFVASFSDGVDNFPVSELIVNIIPSQPGTGNPSSENIRTISGWDSVEIRCAGKNLWGGDALLADIKAAIPSAFVDYENRIVRFASSYTTTNPLCGKYNGLRRGFQFVEDTQYTFIFTMYRSGTASNMRVTYTNGSYRNISAAPELEVKGTVVYVSDLDKTIERLSKIQNDGTVTIYADESGIFEGVLTASDFKSYVGTSKIVVFPQQIGPVYGGQLNVTTGQLTVTHGMINSYDGETLPGEWISDRDVYSSNASPTTGAQVVYELSTPLVYQVTPVQISSLFDITNIYANTGSIQKLVYARDTFDSIARLINNKVSDNSYSLSISNGRITLTSNSGETSYVDLPVYEGAVD